MEQKVLTIKDIGNVTLKRSQRAKHINITIKPFQDIKVSVPKGVSFNLAEKTVFDRIDWIKRHLPRMKKAEQNFTIFDEKTQFKTKEHILQIIQQDISQIKLTLSNGIIKIVYPLSRNIHDNNIQLIIRKGIEKAWRKEAKHYIPEKVKYLSQKYGFKVNDVKIKNSKTRWGSYSPLTNNINLSLHVMRLPEYLIDYIILHELTHIKIKKHNHKFWSLLDKMTKENIKKLEKELKNYSIQIY